jgi:hypothetical protein
VVASGALLRTMGRQFMYQPTPTTHQKCKHCSLRRKDPYHPTIPSTFSASRSSQLHSQYVCTVFSCLAQSQPDCAHFRSISRSNLCDAAARNGYVSTAKKSQNTRSSSARSPQPTDAIAPGTAGNNTHLKSGGIAEKPNLQVQTRRPNCE